MDDQWTLNVAGIVGSLTASSFNRGLYRAALELLPPGMSLIELPIGDLPFYSEDRDGLAAPETVHRFRAGIAAADALIFFTPEYNYSIPGVLKNALDWASRPTGEAVIWGKPAAVMGASVGRSGTMRAQLHLRQIFVTINVQGLNKPEIFMPYAGDKFDAEGRLVDEDFREQIRMQLIALRAWVVQLRNNIYSEI
jgi:chromate reductase